MPSSFFQSAKTCSRCGGPRDRGIRYRLCRDCHREYMKEWRASHTYVDLSGKPVRRWEPISNEKPTEAL